MQATLHKKSGGMHHVKKSGGMKLMKKTGGMATTKKIGGMNMTKKSGGNCGMPLATSGGMRRKTVKGGMYHSKKHGGSRKVIGGGENEVIIDGNKYHITVNRGSVTVKAMEPESFEATKVPVLDKDGFPVPPPTTTTTTTTGTTELDAEDGGPLKTEDLNANNEGAQLNIDALIAPEDQEGNEDQEGEEDPFTDTQSETLETLINNIKEGDFDKQKIINAYNKLTNSEDQDGFIEYIKNSDLVEKDEILDVIDPKDGLPAMGIYNGGGKKKGGKTLKKGGKPVKKHGGSVKKAFNKLFKRGGNKALPKKGGKK